MRWDGLEPQLGRHAQRPAGAPRDRLLALALGVLIAFPIGLIAYRRSSLSTGPRRARTSSTPSPRSRCSSCSSTGRARPAAGDHRSDDLLPGDPGAQHGRGPARACRREVTDAATAMGYRRFRRLFAVELPLALPTIIAGLRARHVSADLAGQRRRGDRQGRPRPAVHRRLPERQPDRDLGRGPPHDRCSPSSPTC